MGEHSNNWINFGSLSLAIPMLSCTTAMLRNEVDRPAEHSVQDGIGTHKADPLFFVSSIVMVDTSDEGHEELKERVESYLHREFRSLGDVALPPNGLRIKDHLLFVSVDPIYAPMGTLLGYSFFYELYRPIEVDSLRATLSNLVPETLVPQVNEALDGYLGGKRDIIVSLGEMDHQSLGKDQLREMCEILVTKMDKNYFQPLRENAEFVKNRRIFIKIKMLKMEQQRLEKEKASKEEKKSGS